MIDFILVERGGAHSPLETGVFPTIGGGFYLKIVSQRFDLYQTQVGYLTRGCFSFSIPTKLLVGYILI